MRIEYLTQPMNYQDGTKESFNLRLSFLAKEISLRNKMGCIDASVPRSVLHKLSDPVVLKRYEKAREEHDNRYNEVTKLIETIRDKVDYKQKIDEDYLYELWISRIFELDWKNGDPINNLKNLKEALKLNPKINPYDVDINKSQNVKSKGFGLFKKRNKN